MYKPRILPFRIRADLLSIEHHLTAYSDSSSKEKSGKRPATLIHFLMNNAHRLMDHCTYRANYMYRFCLS